MKAFLTNIYINQKLHAFETMFGFFCIYGGATGMLKFGIVNTAYSHAFSETFLLVVNIIYLLAGFGISFGIGLRRGDVEAFGLIILTTTLIIRTLMLGFLFGIDPVVINAYVLNLIFAASCIVRIKIILDNNKFLKQNSSSIKPLEL